MKKQYIAPAVEIITISREYGSGGHEVGVLLAERLGIPIYDKELLTLLSNP